MTPGQREQTGDAQGLGMVRANARASRGVAVGKWDVAVGKSGECLALHESMRRGKARAYNRAYMRAYTRSSMRKGAWFPMRLSLYFAGFRWQI